MLDHPLVDVGLGLIFFYVILSLVASAVQEWVASLFGLRSKTLQAGIKRLISDEYAQKVYSHPLVKNLAKENKLPSYLAPETISAVLLEVIARDKNGKSYVAHTGDEARELVRKIEQNHPLRGILEALITNSENAAEELKDKLAGWFDEGMSRVSGWYKRQVKVIIFCIAGTVTIATNASSIHIAEELWSNDALRTQIAAQAQASSHQEDVTRLDAGNLEALKTFPIGWQVPPDGAIEWLKTILGWLITVAAVSLGAPFWFDLLGKVANLKGSGGKAPEKVKS